MKRDCRRRYHLRVVGEQSEGARDESKACWRAKFTSAGVFIVSSSRVKILKKQGSRYLIEASKLLFISIAPLALTKVAIPLFEES